MSVGGRQKNRPSLAALRTGVDSEKSLKDKFFLWSFRGRLSMGLPQLYMNQEWATDSCFVLNSLCEDLWRKSNFLRNKWSACLLFRVIKIKPPCRDRCRTEYKIFRFLELGLPLLYSNHWTSELGDRGIPVGFGAQGSSTKSKLLIFWLPQLS